MWSCFAGCFGFLRLVVAAGTPSAAGSLAFFKPSCEQVLRGLEGVRDDGGSESSDAPLRDRHKGN